MTALASALWLGPLLALVGLSLAWWSRRPLAEPVVSGAVMGAFSWSGLAALGLLFTRESGTATLGTWFSADRQAYLWTQSLDPLGLLTSLMGCTLIGLIAVFSASYLHREPGYLRFHLLTTLLGIGVLLVTSAANLEQLILGWELVGLCSALLIAFFSNRVEPAGNALRAFLTYRLGDVGLLVAAMLLHHGAGSTEFTPTESGWWAFPVPSEAGVTTAVVLGLLLACCAKSALVPLGGWLPRAMEGPTPSSAIFYGALSIHLGPFLLLRAWPLLEASPVGRTAVLLVGLATVAHGTLVGRVQSDVKSALAYASMTQVGLIIVEIALGWTWLALWHMLGHAGLRTLELLRSPSLLHDVDHLERSLGESLPRMGRHYDRILPVGLRLWLYRLALERGVMEAAWLHLSAGVGSLVRRLDRADRALEKLLCGTRSEERP